MKKIGLLVMALVLAMGMLGVGYAMWSETLTIDGTVHTGTVDVEFSQYSNDDGEHGYTTGNVSAGNLDPKVPGTWTPTADPTSNPPGWTGDREVKNVASTNCGLSENTLTITVDNGYPCYFGSVLFDIENVGTIPVKVLSFKLIEVSKDGTTIDIDDLALTACKWYYVDVDAVPPTVRESDSAPPAGFEDDEDFAFHLSEYSAPYDLVQIDPGEVGYGDITVHIEQDAEMNTIYDFTIEVEVCNWNEP